MRPIQSFAVVPSLPIVLAPLRKLSYNLWWCWNHEGVGLFRRIDPHLWEESGHNPIRILGMVSEERLRHLATDDAFLDQMTQVEKAFDSYMARPAWFGESAGEGGDHLIAYFSLEFGITESLPIYSGGLGALAGDHLKSASDLGVPLIAVGLLYQEGYFRQRLSADGMQSESYPANDFYQMPVTLMAASDGKPLQLTVDFAGDTVRVRVWRAQIGRVQLFLLDTNIAENSPDANTITDRLYGGDSETRIRQEILLGIGGARALAAMGLKPSVFHMNEGHAAFSALERIRLLIVERKITFAEARELVQASTVFTTHTPVPAGHDRFSRPLMAKYFENYAKELGVQLDQLMQLGAENHEAGGDLVMTALALRLADYRNAVSRLHGEVSRNMWQQLWPQTPVSEISIGHVTNGVHVRSWISRDMSELYDQYLGPRWKSEPADQSVWEGALELPPLELWGTHERRRQRLVAFVRRRVRAQLTARGAPDSETARVDNLLNPQTLTIGFARRFATYKRADLILTDPDRLERLLRDPQRPVQIIFAGKAHPRDEEAKQIIRHITALSREPRFQQHIVFLENYDLDTARYLVQGVDVWLNNPRRPLEASGTSGMKAAANGALNVSVLDGWWDEAYTPEVGWAIGTRDGHSPSDYHPDFEAASLYDLLEHTIVPLFYDRAADVVPHKWIARMKASISSLAAVFNTNRMVREYCERFYIPANARSAALSADDLARCKGLAWWKGHMSFHWNGLQIQSIESDIAGELTEGASMEVRATVVTGEIIPNDVTVQIYEGPLDSGGEIGGAQIVKMEKTRTLRSGAHVFVGKASCRGSGRHGFTVRALPRHDDLLDTLGMGLIRWA